MLDRANIKQAHSGETRLRQSRKFIRGKNNQEKEWEFMGETIVWKALVNSDIQIYFDEKLRFSVVKGYLNFRLQEN